MVCCTLIAALLGMLLAPFNRAIAPLAWRPHNGAPPARRFSPMARLRSFGFAIAGLKFLVRNEHNMRLHGVAAMLAVAAGLVLHIAADEWRWLIVAISLVIAAEAMNTAIEQVCNAVTRAQNPAIGAAKDVAAGAVLLCALAAALIGLSVFVPHLSDQADFVPVSFCGHTILFK